MRKIATLPQRTVLAVRGPDRVGFLQGLVSNDVTRAAPGRAVWAALLTPQGKYLADFFIVEGEDETLLLDCEASVADTVAQRLSRLRLRAKVEVMPVPLVVHALWDGIPDPGSAAFPDPRLAEAGHRVLAPAFAIEATAEENEYDRHRLLLGLPDGTRDLEPDRTVLLEAGFDELDGVSWTKGCFMGQELTARTRYRGLIKRRLVPVAAEGPLPAAGTPLLGGTPVRELGTMRSSRDELGLATVRIEALHERLQAGDTVLHARVPAWLKLPVAAPTP